MKKDNPKQKEHKINEVLLEELLQQSVLLKEIELEEFDENEPEQVQEPELDPDQTPDPFFAMEMPVEKTDQSTEISRVKKELDEYMTRKPAAVSRDKTPEKKWDRKEKNSDDRKDSSEIAFPKSFDSIKMPPNKEPKSIRKSKPVPEKSKPVRKKSKPVSEKKKPVSEKSSFHQDPKITALQIERDFCLRVGPLREKPKIKQWGLALKQCKERGD